MVAKSFARIHAANLINAGILPLTFQNAEDYEALSQDDSITIGDIREGMAKGKLTMMVGNRAIQVCCDLTDRQQKILLAGGLLNYTKEDGQ